MVLIYLIAIILLFWKISFQKRGIYEGYIDKKQCNVIKGLFFIFVFAGHIFPYLDNVGFEFNTFIDSVAIRIWHTLGQLIVVMFLYYSGYGVMESFRKKGQSYVNSMPKKRLLPTLLNFDVAIIVFLIVDSFVGLKYSAIDIVFAFTGWTSVGNSNWYIFVILMCYLSTYIGLKTSEIIKYKEILIKWWVILVLIALIFILLRLTKDSYWFDTIFAYPFGVYYAIYKNKIEEIVQQRYRTHMAIALILGIFWLFFPYHHHWLFLYGNIRAVFFVIMIVMLTMKVQLKSPALVWLGKNLFPLYIYQRIGMIILSNVANGLIIKEYPYLYILSCAVLTLIFGWLYRFVQIRLK